MNVEYKEYLREGKISLEKFLIMMKKEHNLKTDKQVAEKVVDIIFKYTYPKEWLIHTREIR